MKFEVLVYVLVMCKRVIRFLTDNGYHLNIFLDEGIRTDKQLREGIILELETIDSTLRIRIYTPLGLIHVCDALPIGEPTSFDNTSLPKMKILQMDYRRKNIKRYMLHRIDDMIFPSPVWQDKKDYINKNKAKAEWEKIIFQYKMKNLKNRYIQGMFVNVRQNPENHDLLYIAGKRVMICHKDEDLMIVMFEGKEIGISANELCLFAAGVL